MDLATTILPDLSVQGHRLILVLPSMVEVYSCSAAGELVEHYSFCGQDRSRRTCDLDSAFSHLIFRPFRDIVLCGYIAI